MYQSELYRKIEYSPSGCADDVWVNGIFYTMDSRNSVAEALCVKDGRIEYIGTREAAGAFIGQGTRVHDLRGHAVLPALMDSHTHVPGLFEKKKYMIFLNGGETIDETLNIVRSFVEAHPDQDSYFGFGYTSIHCADDRGPRKEWLDEICSGKPMVIQAQDGHSWWCNSKGLELFGVDSGRELTGMVVRDDEGRPWGIVSDFTGDDIPRPRFTVEQDMESFLEYQEQLHSLGYSGIRAMEGQITPCPIEAMSILEARGLLKLRVNAARTIFPGKDIGPQIRRVTEERKKTGPLLRVVIAKFFNDGTIGSRSAWLWEPYVGRKTEGTGDAPISRECGHRLWDPEKMLEAFRAAVGAGLQIHVHSIGDRSTSMVLDALEKLRAEYPDADLRPGIAHLDCVRDEDIPRFAKLGCIGAVQSYWALREPGIFETDVEANLGEERARKIYPFRRLIDAGAIISNGSDQPSTEFPNPFVAIQTAVTRNLYSPEKYGVDPITDPDDPRWLLDRDERLTLDQAIRTFTINAAYDMFLEEETGSLEQGKSADFIVLDSDPFNIPVLEIEHIKVLQNVFMGEPLLNTQD